MRKYRLYSQPTKERTANKVKKNLTTMQIVETKNHRANNTFGRNRQVPCLCYTLVGIYCNGTTCRRL